MQKIRELLLLVASWTLLLLLTQPLYAKFTVTIDSCSQRTNGSKLVDVWYTLQGISDSINLKLLALTRESEETLLCETFVEHSDTGVICEDGVYHIAWDAGVDIPGREFYNDRVVFEVTAAVQGVVPGICGKMAIAGGCEHTLALKSDGTVWAWGDNRRNELGDGTMRTYRTIPVQVHGEDNIGFFKSHATVGVNHGMRFCI